MVRCATRGSPVTTVTSADPPTPTRPRTVVVLALTALAASIAGVAGLIDGVHEGGDLSQLDLPLLSWLVVHRQPWATTALTAVTTVGGEVVLVVVSAAAVLALLWWRRRVEALLLGVMLGGAEAISLVLKHLVGRVRPPAADVLGPVDHTLSFPSGHTIGTAAITLGLSYLWWRSRPSGARVAVGLTASASLTVLMATSRLYLADHWLTDVLASGVIAVGMLALVALLDLSIRHRAASRSET